MRNKHFVLGFSAEPDHRRRLQGKITEAALALDRDPTASPGIFQDALGAGFERQLLGAKQLFAIDQAVDNPLVGVAIAAGLLVDDRFQVVVVLEMRVDVLFPVEHLDDEIEILVLVGRHVFHQQRPGHIPAFHDRLEHAEHVAAPLRLVGAKRTGSVEHARRDQPTGSPLQAIGAGQIENAVVALIPVLQAAADVVLRGARFEPHERVTEIIVDVIVLGREIIAFRLAFLAR